MANIVNFDEFRKELTDNEDILRDKLCLSMQKYYRPPEGAYSEANLEFADRLGYRTVFWSLAYADWDNKRQMPKEKALSLLLSRVHPGAVILLHPTSDTNAAILGDFLTELTARGYSFRSLDAFPKREAAS